MSPASPQFTGFVDKAVLSSDERGRATLELSGWIVAPESPLAELWVGVGKAPLFRAILSERADVAARLPGINHALRSGFSAVLPVEERAATYAVRIDGRLANGSVISSTLTATISSPANSELPLAAVPESGEEAGIRAMEASYTLRLEAFLASGSMLDFPHVSGPQVCVIVPALGQPHYLLACLESIRSESASCSLEVVVVDNGSGPETSRLLDQITGITVLRNETNLGFARACNQGARQAHAEALLFLNTDCIVLPGAIKAALNFLSSSPHVGAVGATLLRAHGKLGEAGAFVLPNGTTVARGRGGSRLSPSYGEALTVDYCSAAFLLTPTEVFLRHEGFHEGFDPAYYEDVDYCWRLRQNGLSTVVLPTANAFHIERRSSVTPKAADRLINDHRSYFVSRHAGSLGTSGHRVLKAGDRLLFIDDYLPAARRGQGQGRAVQLLTMLRKFGLNVRLYPVKGGFDQSGEVETAHPGSGERQEVFLKRELQAVDGIFVSRPQHMEVVQRVLRAVQGPASRPVVIYDAEALQAKREVLKLEALQGIELADSEIIEVASNEVAVATEADTIITVSEQEAEAFRDFGYRNVHVVSFGATLRPAETPFEERSGLLTVGPLLEPDTPNVDGVRWFLKEVAPWFNHLTQAGPFALHAVGENRVAALEQLQSDRFKLLGMVQDLTPAYARYRVFVAPTRFAAGIPIKVIEAAAHGLPIVASPLVASQLGWRDEHELLVGYSAQDFAAKCAALHLNRELWARLRANALQRVSRQFDVAAFEASLRRAVIG